MLKLLLPVLCALLPLSVLAKQAPESDVSQLLPSLPASEFSAQARRDTQGQLLSWYALDVAAIGSGPVEQARAFLRQQASVLGLDESALSGLRHVHTRSGPAGHNVHFSQFVAGVEVYRSRYVVHISPAARITQFSRTHGPVALLPRTALLPAINQQDAVRIALNDLQVLPPISRQQVDLRIYSEPGGSRLVWVVQLDAKQPAGAWELLLDAQSGSVLARWDRAVYASGSVFDPDPLSASMTVYAQPIDDQDDASYPEIDAQVVQAEFVSISERAGMFMLDGDWASLVDTEAPNFGLFGQTSDEFVFNREQQGFEASNVYWHIEHSMRYINETLGVSLMPYQYDGGVRFDPQGLDGDDNSHYNSGSGELAFGEGCVDDAEDADVIWHELGHGVHDWITSGGLSNVIDGLSEGFGDYWAHSYSRSLGQWQPDTEQYHWVFNWDGHNECWGGRVTNYNLPWPVGITPYPAIHGGGQIWSSCLMPMHDVLGRERTDLMVLEGLAMTNAISTQNDAANAAYQAAEDMAYSGDDLEYIAGQFASCGYLLLDFLPLPFPVRGGESEGQEGSSGSQRSSQVSRGGALGGGILLLGLSFLSVRRSRAV